MNFFNLTDQTDNLNRVLLGNWASPEYFDSIKNKNIADPLKKLSEEILEDLENFSNVLKEHGVEVYRTQSLDGKFDYADKKIPALAVRNYHHVLGNNLFQLQKNDYHLELVDLFSDYKNHIIDISGDLESEHKRSLHNASDYYDQTKSMYCRKEKYHELAGSDWPNFENFVKSDYSNTREDIVQEIKSLHENFFYLEGLTPLDGPNIILVNGKIVVDSHEYSDYINILKKHVDIENLDWVSINTTAGHTDGCFVYLNKSTVITIKDIVNHREVIDGINEIIIPWENYQQSLEDFKKIKQKNSGKWWIPGEEDNDTMTYFINQYLDHWVGYTEETVFDVNVLPLDSKNVFVSSDKKELHNLLKQNGINPIYVPWRHRFFTDNGLHCITLCLHRG